MDKKLQQDLERNSPGRERVATMGQLGGEHVHSEINVNPFIGRLGGHGVVPSTAAESDESLLKSIPDASPLMTFAEAFNLQPFWTVSLWKSALMEGIGMRIAIGDRISGTLLISMSQDPSCSYG